MANKIMSGKEVGILIKKECELRLETLRDIGIMPTLATIRVGMNEDDISYEVGIAKTADSYGIQVEQFVLEEESDSKQIMNLIDRLNNDKTVHGILVFCPLPSSLDTDMILNKISPAKDVDGVTDVSKALLYCGKEECFAPCAAESCMEILGYYGIKPDGKEAVVIGRSKVIGLPVATLLLHDNATVTVCHTHTKNIMKKIQNADIIVSAAGSACLIKAGWLHEKQVVIDASYNVSSNGKVCGDIDCNGLDETGASYTPVPGGVGNVTNHILMKHLILAAYAQSEATINNKIFLFNKGGERKMFEDLGEKITNFGESVKTGAVNTKDKIALTAKIDQAKKGIRKSYEQLGERLYLDRKNNAPEEYAEIFKAIADNEELIAQCNEQKNVLDGIRKCPNCGADVAKDHLFCTECGTKVEFPDQQKPEAPEKRFCTACGALVDPDAKFCNKCGNQL